MVDEARLGQRASDEVEQTQVAGVGSQSAAMLSCASEVTFSGLTSAVTKVNYSSYFEKPRCNAIMLNEFKFIEITLFHSRKGCLI